MTSTDHQPTVSRTPGAVVVVRVLVGIQAVVALVGTATMIFLALLALAWVSDAGDLGLSVACLLGAGAVLAAYGVTLITSVAALRRGADRVRRRLVVLESVLLGGVLLLAQDVGDRIGFGSSPMSATVLGCTAGASLVALLQPSTRRWCRR